MAATAPYDARAIANFLLDEASRRGSCLTQISLLKLIYFSHGWYLVGYAKPLIAHDFEAWQYGPVIKVVRDAFKNFGSKPITTRASKLDIMTGEITTVSSELSQEDASFICSVYSAYHQYDAWQLSEMTHERGSPWDALWNSSNPVGRLGLRIKNEEIHSHFLALQQKMPHI